MIYDVKVLFFFLDFEYPNSKILKDTEPGKVQLRVICSLTAIRKSPHPCIKNKSESEELSGLWSWSKDPVHQHWYKSVETNIAKSI